MAITENLATAENPTTSATKRPKRLDRQPEAAVQPSEVPTRPGEAATSANVGAASHRPIGRCEAAPTFADVAASPGRVGTSLGWTAASGCRSRRLGRFVADVVGFSAVARFSVIAMFLSWVVGVSRSGWHARSSESGINATTLDTTSSG